MDRYKGSDSCFYFHQQHHNYSSAPSSPTAFTSSFHSGRRGRQSSIPFEWEERPGTPNSHYGNDDATNPDDFDFALAFDRVSQRHEKVSFPALADADELFEMGMIRPLKPTPQLSSPTKGDQSPKSPKSRGLFSPLRRRRGRAGKEIDPFDAAVTDGTGERKNCRDRNYRNPSTPSMSYSRSRKGSRSLSPFRGRGGGFRSPTSSPPSPLAGKSGGGGRKWRLKDFLLFRRGDGSKDALSKHGSFSSSSSSSSSTSSSMSKAWVKGSSSGGEDSKNSSFRSVDSGPMRWGGAVTPHEKHYTENRAAAAELKKKTALPYRHSIFGFLRFSPAVRSRAGGGSTGSSYI